MISPGTTQINNYHLWISAPVFTPEGYEFSKLPYYEVKLTKTISGMTYYVNINKQKLLNGIDYNKPHAQVDRKELEAFVARKDQEMPLFLLNNSNVLLLIETIKNLKD